MRTITIILAAACAACATPSDLRSKPPEAAFTSSRSAQQVADCVAERWDAIPVTIGPARTRALPGGGATVMLMEGNYMASMADVRPTPGGSSSAFWSIAMAISAREAKAALQACQ